MSLSEANQPEFYQSVDNIKTLVSEALVSGHLRIVLGAGISSALGLPEWNDLVSRMAVILNATPKGNDAAAKSDWLLRNTLDNDKKQFDEIVREALYKNYDTSMEGLSTHPLMVALGALSLPGQRGGVSEIITFNFDNLLEIYLRYLGFVVNTTTELPSLSKKCDVEVLHIHGTLPYPVSKEIPRDIVFTEDDFDTIVGKNNFWADRVNHILRSNLCLFIGLSGNDPNLRSLLKNAKTDNPLMRSNPYWGFRFTSETNDPKRNMFNDNGICQITMPHVDLPSWLLSITDTN